MSIRFDAVGDSVNRTTTPPSISVFTMMGWFRIAVNRATFSTFMAAGAPASSAYFQVAAGTDGVTLGTYDGNGAAFNSGTTTLVVGTWYHIAFTVAGTGAGQFITYLNSVPDQIKSGNALPTASQIWFGNSADADWLNGNAFAGKLWSGVALTANQIALEMKSVMPVRYQNLYGCWPMIGNTTTRDYVRGQNLTANGTLTTEANPPVPWNASGINFLGRPISHSIPKSLPPYDRRDRMVRALQYF